MKVNSSNEAFGVCKSEVKTSVCLFKNFFKVSSIAIN